MTTAALRRQVKNIVHNYSEAEIKVLPPGRGRPHARGAQHCECSGERHGVSAAPPQVREATSNDPWGPSSSLMSEIADLTFNVVAFAEVMGMVWKRLNDSGKNWRHVYKVRKPFGGFFRVGHVPSTYYVYLLTQALTLLDYLLKTGSERVAQQCCENAFTIQVLQ